MDVAVAEMQLARTDPTWGLAHGVNPLESAWYVWLVLYHPIVLKSAQVGRGDRLASSVGKSGALDRRGRLSPGAACARRRGGAQPSLARAVARLVRRSLAQPGFGDPGVSSLSMKLIWFNRRITTYGYHYLTPWGIALVLLAGARRAPRSPLPRAGAGRPCWRKLAVFIYFAPVWAELPLSVSAAHRRLVFPMWQ